MTGQQLKNSIFQMAVEGKLVPQDESDEPASVLIDRIAKEKEQLIKDKKIKKDKNVSRIFKGEDDGLWYEEVGKGEIKCIEEELPFTLPNGWSWINLNNISDMYTGNSINEQLKITKYTNLKEGFDYIATKDINFDNTIVYDNGVKIPFEEVKFKNTYEKSILLCLEGGSAGKKIALTNKKVCFGNKLCSINSLGNNISYIYYFLQSSIFLVKFESLKNGIIGGVGINKLKNILIPLPPLAEQHRIVQKLEELLPLIDDYGDAHAKLEVLNAQFPKDFKKSILQWAIQGKLVPQDERDEPANILINRIAKEKEQLIKDKKIKKDKNTSRIFKGEDDGLWYEEVEKGKIKCIEEELPFEVPKGWSWCRLGSVFQFINGDRGKNYPSKEKLYLTGNIPFISAINMDCLTIKTDNLLYVSNEQYNLLGSGKLKINDIVICIRGSLGKCCIYPYEMGAVASSLVILRNFAGINNLFVINYVTSNLFYSEIKKYDNGTAQPNLSATDLKKFLIPLPPLAEQHRIVQKLEEILNEVDKL